MSATSAKSETVMIDAAAAAGPAKRTGPSCSSCPHFRMPTSNREAVARMAGDDAWRGECNLQPEAVRKHPDSSCGQHPEIQAKHLLAAFSPLAQTIGAAIGAALAGQGKR